MEKTAQKVLVIGLDGATFDLLDILADQNLLPNLSRLKQAGSWGRLASTIPPFTAAAWSSVITGQNPGQHGIINFATRDAYNYDTLGSGFVNAGRFETTLWEILSEAGKKVGVVNVPLTYPVRAVNGYMVSGMLTPSSARQITFPPEFAAQLGPDYIIDVDFIRDGEQFRLHGLPPKETMLPQIQQMSRQRAQTCLRLLAEKPWDFFMVVFTGTDRISHFFWDDLLPPPAADPTPIQQGLWAYFKELDTAVGQMIETAGEETTVFIISDHGFGAAPDRRFYVNIWLEKLGLLQPRSAESLLDLEFWRVRVGRQKRLKALLRKILPQTTQDNVKTAAESRSKEIFDWSRTQAYFVPIYFHVCGIDINRVNSRREGIVDGDEAYEALRSRLISEAKKLRDPHTGQAIVDIAARREELFHGRYVSDFPDVILVLKPEYVGAGSLAGTSLFEGHPHPIRPGEHREDGIFIAAGANIAANGEQTELQLLDVPATVLYALDVPVPEQFDGRVLSHIFSRVYQQSVPVRHQTLPTPAASEPAAALSAAEADEVEKRLRGLGYLE